MTPDLAVSIARERVKPRIACLEVAYAAIPGYATRATVERLRTSNDDGKRAFMKELADYTNGSVSMGMRDRLNVVYVETCRSGNGMTSLPDIGTSVPIAQSVIGRAFLYACTPPEREALLNQMKVKEPESLRKYRPQIDKSIEDIRGRGFCTSLGEIRREVHAAGAPMRRTVDGEIVSFNCAVPAFMLKKNQLEDDIGPRLVSMVRDIEAALGMA